MLLSFALIYSHKMVDIFTRSSALLRRLSLTRTLGLAFMGTLPGFQEQGAGTLLTQWGLSNAKKANVPVYLRSTILASSLYRRLGFVALDGL